MSVTIVTRVSGGSPKGAPLTNAELDANFININAVLYKDKLDATVAPGVTNDSSEGYSVRSNWIDVTGDDWYVCVDSTVGAAVWISGGGAAVEGTGLKVYSFTPANGDTSVSGADDNAVTLAYTAGYVFAVEISGSSLAPEDFVATTGTSITGLPSLLDTDRVIVKTLDPQVLPFEGGATMTEYVFTATGGETSLSGLDDNSQTLSYTVGYVKLYWNTGRINKNLITATNGTSITLPATAVAGDVYVVEAFNSTAAPSNVYTKTQVDDGFYSKLDFDASTTVEHFYYVATGGETSLSGADVNGDVLAYVAANDDVEIVKNGFNLWHDDYAFTTGTSITSLEALVAGDEVEVIVSHALEIADMYTKAAADAKYELIGAVVPGGYASMQVFTADGTWTKPAGINLIVVEVVGGGGGGGYGLTAWPSAGGGAGGTAIKTIDVSAISSETVTVGLGGSGGISSSSTEPGVGQAAESSSFGAHCSATPGVDSTATQYRAGGTGTGGDINIRGGASDSGHQINSGHSYDMGGAGGDSTRGPGGSGGNQNAGQDGVNGSGGGGCYSATGYDGGDGGDGIVIVWEYK